MLNPVEKLHMAHRCWRYRFKSEVPSIDFVRNADLTGKTLLDIGANRGIYSIYMSRAAGDAGRVVCFEAQPELESHLLAVKRSFGLANLDVQNIALSSQNGVLKLQRSKIGAGSASFEDERSPALEAVTLPVVRLDDYLDSAGIDNVHFIKCDVEGHELDVLRGAERVLERDSPILLLECSDEVADAGELFGFLGDLGYDGFFYHVSRADHRSYLHKNRGRYVRAADFERYEHVRPGLSLRNYLFVQRGTRPEAVHRLVHR